MKFLIASYFVLLILAAVCSSVRSKHIGCYYASWAIYRTGNGQFEPENMDLNHCTHIIYGFAGLDPSTYEVMSLDTWADLPSGLNGYMRFTGLTAVNPNVVPLLGVGGWNEGSEKFSAMASSDTTRNAFINSVMVFMETYGFKGIDLDWEYPTQRGGKPEDKENFVSLIQGLKSAFSSQRYVLSVAVGVNYGVSDIAYDVPTISQTADFIDLLTFDYHTYLDGDTGHGEPLNARSDEDPTFGVNASIQYWLNAGADPAKLNMALALYGHTFTLSDEANNGPHAPISGAGLAGPYTANSGTLGYYEICANNWPPQIDSAWNAPYAYSGNQWVSYDDPTSIIAKCQLAKSLNIGGAWVYSLDTDDFLGTCGGGNFPLITTLYNNC